MIVNLIVNVSVDAIEPGVLHRIKIFCANLMK